MARLYLYALIDRPGPRALGPIGVGTPPAEVRVVPRGDLGVVESDVGDGSLAPGAADVLAHQAVLDRLLADHTVLPFRFATVAEDAAAVERLLDGMGGQCQSYMEKLRDRIEVGLKVFWNKEAMRTEVLRALARSGKAAEAGGGAGAARNDAILVGQTVERLVLRWRDRHVPEILSCLRPLAEDVAVGDLISPTMLWNASFLIIREREVAFRAGVHDLDARLGDRLNFRYAAPLPPYNFVQLHYGPSEEVQA